MSNDQQLEPQLREIAHLEEKGFIKEALALADALCEKYPENARVAFERASLAVNNLYPRKSLAAAKDFAQRFPKDHNGPILLAWANLRVKRGAEALRQIDAAAALGAPLETVRSMRLHALEASGKRKEILLATTTAKDLASLRARLIHQPPADESKLEVAIEEMRVGGETPTNLARDRAWWYWNRGMLKEAEQALQEALRDDESSVVLNWELSKVERKSGKPDEAMRRVEAILNDHPEHQGARQTAMMFSLLRGRIGDAIRHLRLAVKWNSALNAKGGRQL